MHYLPVFMKKNRPGVQIQVICEPELRTKMEEILFRETTTIGIRRAKMERTVLNREACRVHTPFGEIDGKKVSAEGFERIYPEYESAAELAAEKEVPLYEVLRSIKA